MCCEVDCPWQPRVPKQSSRSAIALAHTRSATVAPKWHGEVPLSRMAKMTAQHVATRMKTMDWADKHVYYGRVMGCIRWTRLRYRQAINRALANSFAPDEFLYGKLTGVKPRLGRAIPLLNIRPRDYRGYRQLTLRETFER